VVSATPGPHFSPGNGIHFVIKIYDFPFPHSYKQRMQEMLDEEDERSSESYTRVAREQASDEEKLLGISRVLSPSAS
jgi:hypothetical protein